MNWIIITAFRVLDFFLQLIKEQAFLCHIIQHEHSAKGPHKLISQNSKDVENNTENSECAGGEKTHSGFSLNIKITQSAVSIPLHPFTFFFFFFISWKDFNYFGSRCCVPQLRILKMGNACWETVSLLCLCRSETFTRTPLKWIKRRCHWNESSQVNVCTSIFSFRKH